MQIQCPHTQKNKVLMSINLVSSGPAGEDLLWAQARPC